MKKKQFSILCIGLILTACGQQNKNETTMDFTDDVQTALCSPEESSFTAIFSDMKITECAWKAHDGQQPDENM